MTALVPMTLKSILASIVAASMAGPIIAQSPCDADLDHDGIVAGADLALVLGDWGPCKGCQGDLTNNGTVDGIDLAFVLTLWGGECSQLPWATVIEQLPDPSVVHDADLRTRIFTTGLPWRVRDNGTGIEMLLVPPGNFQMGCVQGSLAAGCYEWEVPVHSVTLTSAYYIGRYEVTQAQWQEKMGSNPSYFQPPITPTANGARPIESVSRTMIQSFLEASNLRLPTEAEWEYACRAGTATPLHSGPDFPDGTIDESFLEQIAWFDCNGGCNTHAVGGKAGNALGLHDMLGNVWELASDWWSLYTPDSAVDPSGPPLGSFKVWRGGSWADARGRLRSSDRVYDYGADSVHIFAGFRVARNP